MVKLPSGGSQLFKSRLKEVLTGSIFTERETLIPAWICGQGIVKQLHKRWGQKLCGSEHTLQSIVDESVLSGYKPQLPLGLLQIIDPDMNTDEGK